MVLSPLVKIQLYPAKLDEARQNVDQERFVRWLGLQESDKSRARSRDNDRWFQSPWNPTERTPSFHMQPDGAWTDFSAGRSGGYIQLAESLLNRDCYSVVREMIRAGVTFITDDHGQRVGDDSIPVTPLPHRHVESFNREEKKKAGRANQLLTHNPHDLLKAEFVDFQHPEILKRVSEKTAREFGVGYYHSEKSRMPLNGRILFKLSGVREDRDGSLMVGDLDRGFLGRALPDDQRRIDAGGKYKFYPGFNSSVEVYGLDQLLTNEQAIAQAQETGHVVLVEGCFDLLRLVDAGVRNGIGLFTGNMAIDKELNLPAQLPSFNLIVRHLGVRKFVLMLDRGYHGTERVAELLRSAGLEVEVFDWHQTFTRGAGHRSWKLDDAPDGGGITDPGSVPIKIVEWWRRYGYL